MPGAGAGLVAFPRRAVFGGFLCRDVGNDGGYQRRRGSAHHAVLLWPFPHLLVAITLAAIPWRPAAAAITVALTCSNLLVWNQYLYQFERDGAAQVFSDAINPLSEKVGSYSASSIYVTDWGMWNTLALLHQGRLRISGIDDLFSDAAANQGPNPERQELVDRVLADRDAIFVGHVPEQEVFKGVSERLVKSAEMAGLSKQEIETISDSNGRPMFDIFRIVPR